MIRVDDEYSGYHAITNNPDYLFVQCDYIDDSDVKHRCLVPFSEQFLSYRIDKIIHTDPPIYLAKKQAP
jgi:hypothetical protein